jgi:hypothetical protein
VSNKTREAARSHRTAPHSQTKRHRNSTALHYALKWAAQGRYVTPIDEHKRPLVRDWPTSGASCDPEQIRRWSRLARCSGFGVVLGAISHEVVLDIDTQRGGTVAGLDLPPTLTVQTPNGGTHHHFAVDGPVGIDHRFGQGVEVLGDGAQAVLPGSRVRRKDGTLGTYTLRRDADAVLTVAALPPRLTPPPRATSAAEGRSGALEGSPKGRHESLLSRAVRVRKAAGLDPGELGAVLTVYNERYCVPPKPADEVRRIAEWAGGLPLDDDEADIEQQERRLYVNEEAKRRHAAKLAVAQFELPPVGRTLADDLKDPPPPIRYRIAELHPQDTNTLFVAAYGAGKTTVAVNLLKSLADGVPFLGRFAVDFPTGKIAYGNYEMAKSQFDRWLDDADIENQDRIVKLDLRGMRMPLNAPGVTDRLVEWLQGNEVKFLIIDTLAKANVGVVDNENDNMQARDFTDALDELLKRASVPDSVVTAHMGRQAAFMQSGEERSRGATRYQDWADASWHLNKDASGTRTLWAEGRDVELRHDDAVVLGFDERTRRVFATGQTRKDTSATDAANETMVKLEKLLADPKTKTEYVLASALRTKLSQKARNAQGIAVCERLGWLHVEPAGNAHHITITDNGSARRIALAKVSESGSERLSGLPI